MLFNSFEYLLFLPVVFLLYWLLKHNTWFQNVLLLVASYLFYGWWDWRFLLLIFASSAVDFFAALYIHTNTVEKKRKIALYSSLIFNLGLLGIFKYYNFFAENFSALLHSAGIESNPFYISIILPVGISFYTFQTMSYTIDVYKGKLSASANFVNFLAYVSFFPQLVAGPIERATHLLPQFENKRELVYTAFVSGCNLILWGLFKKVVIADNMATVADGVFSNIETQSVTALIIGSICFTIQIYCDFSGYSDIAIGSSRLLGFNLSTNFQTPFFSSNLIEFWKRWHITLTSWFRDYVYIPLGGNKSGLSKTIVNLSLVFLISGLWHGANFTFIAWGCLHAVAYAFSYIYKNKLAFKELSPVWFLGVFVTFAFTCFAFIFFRAENLNDAFLYISRLFSNETFFSIPVGVKKYFLPLIGFWIMLEWSSRNNNFAVFIENMRSQKMANLIVYSTLLLFLFYGAFGESAFIYFQF